MIIIILLYRDRLVIFTRCVRECVGRWAVRSVGREREGERKVGWLSSSAIVLRAVVVVVVV